MECYNKKVSFRNCTKKVLVVLFSCCCTLNAALTPSFSPSKMAFGAHLPATKSCNTLAGVIPDYNLHSKPSSISTRAQALTLRQDPHRWMSQLHPSPQKACGDAGVQRAEQTSRFMMFWGWLQRRSVGREDLCRFGGEGGSIAVCGAVLPYTGTCTMLSDRGLSSGDALLWGKPGRVWLWQDWPSAG